MLVARRISDQAYATDFQTRADAETLTANALASGFVKDASELEILDVSPEAFESLVQEAYAEHWAAEARAKNALITRMTALAQGAVGKRPEDLSAAEHHALQFILVWKAGGLDREGRIAPLADWMG